MLTSSKGTILQCDVSGRVMMRAYLTGMPECKIGLNDKIATSSVGSGLRQASASEYTATGKSNVQLDDCQFHQCVKLSNFNTDRTITFIPPGMSNVNVFTDGEFELIKYRSTENVQLPFKVHAAVVEVNSGLVEYKVVVKSQFSDKMNGQNVILRYALLFSYLYSIPTPPNASKTSISVSHGKAKYVGTLLKNYLM